MDTTVSDPLVGRVLAERYRVDSRIARGGMATVYRGQDLRLDRSVALKVMHAALAEDEDFVSRFIGEAKSAARLSHPHVVSVYDQGSDAGTVFLTMEYLSGRTVRDLLAERGRLEPAEALSIMEAVLAALAAAHQAGFAHRDIKPENVLLSDDGQIKVGDFGLARAIAASNHTKTSGLLIGTVAYLSPEQVTRGVADARSDVYSAGILLFELLTGRQPFGGETPLAVAYAHVNGDVPAPSTLVPRLPRELDALVAAATQRDPEQRPAHARSLLDLTTRVRRALESGSQGDGVHTLTMAVRSGETLVVPVSDLAPSVGAPSDEAAADEAPEQPGRLRRAAEPLRTRRGVLAFVGVLLLAVLASGAGYYYGWGRWTQTPSLTGMALAEATQKAEARGFRVTTADPRFSDTVPKGRVVATDPPAGGRILEGGTIALIPSKGKRRVTVPDVAGQSLASAKRELRQADLEPGEVTRAYSTSAPIGQVIRTEPETGAKLTVGSPVTLVASAGVEVPGVVGEPRGRAIDTLENAGFEAVVVDERHEPEAPEGTVVAQSPSGGGAEKGSAVELTISLGPKPVPIPDVVGEPLNQAKKKLRAAGFAVDVRNLPLPGDRVVAQRPDGKAPRGTTIHLIAF